MPKSSQTGEHQVNLILLLAIPHLSSVPYQLINYAIIADVRHDSCTRYLNIRKNGEHKFRTLIQFVERHQQAV